MATNLTPDEIWGENVAEGRQADLFNRRQEAEHLIAYIESVVGRNSIREDKRAYTIAIDARYGEGKTFFLRRLAEHLSITNPVAFIDAWADDLSDEPLTALAATLKAALEPFMGKPQVKSRVADFMSKSGKVAKIVGWGLVRRGAGLLLTGKAVDAAEDLLANVSEDVKDSVDDGLKDVAQGGVDDTAQAIGSISAQAFMEKRITEFEEGKLAVQRMKDSLEAIVALLDGEQQPPIIIVIDELDRCRPTYAVKLLEEIKHLFDVPGLVFILALHSEQLSHSVSGAYGAGFDGRAYLKRFVDREYQLATPSLVPLLDKIYANFETPSRAFNFPPLATATGDVDPSMPQLIAEYMKVYGLGARDAFELMDIIQTSIALAERQTLHVPYFLPLAIGVVKGLPPGDLPKPLRNSNWSYVPNWSINNGDVTQMNFADLAYAIREAVSMPGDKLRRAIEEETSDYAMRLVANNWRYNSDEPPIWTIYGYPRLMKAVARFANPKIEKA